MKTLVFLIVFVLPLMGVSDKEDRNFQVQINLSGVDTQNQGKVVVGIYDEKNFLKKMVHQSLHDPVSKEIKTQVTLPEGTYCFSVYQDTNENQKLDRNFIGIPKEPIAFSNNYKPFGPPKFKGCAVVVSKDLTVALKMEKVF